MERGKTPGRWMVVLAWVLILPVMSCSEDATRDLDGKWQLRRMVDANGTEHAVDTVWYNFQNSLFMYQLLDNGAAPEPRYMQCYGFLSRQGDSLSLQLTSNPVPVEQFLPYTDWPGAHRTFVIQALSSQHLTLSNNGVRYLFIRF